MSHEGYPDEWLLPRRHDLEPRRWQLPSGEIVGEAINREAIELLKRDPEEYFRRSQTRASVPDQPKRSYFGDRIAIWEELPGRVIAFGLHVLTPKIAREVAADLLAAADAAERSRL
jgi:hypothetical protein